MPEAAESVAQEIYSMIKKFTWSILPYFTTEKQCLGLKDRKLFLIYCHFIFRMYKYNVICFTRDLVQE